MKNLIGRGSGETVQMAFGGQGWVLVQPSEGRRRASGSRRAPALGGGLGGLRNSERGLPRSESRGAPAYRWTTSSAASSTICSQRRAPPARLERGRRRRCGAGARRRPRPRAPVGQQPQRAGQLAAAPQLVDEPRRALGVGARDHERLLGERLQPRAEHVRRDPAELLLELVEALRAVSSAATTSSVQRSPTRSSASARGEAGRGGRWRADAPANVKRCIEEGGIEAPWAPMVTSPPVRWEGTNRPAGRSVPPPSMREVVPP